MAETLIQPLSVREDYHVIVTLDIGDTYSGYAYTYKDEFLKDSWTVHTNDSWKWEKNATNKTCTTLLLKPDDKFKDGSYGYEAEMQYKEKFLDEKHGDYLLFKNIKQQFYKDGVNHDTMITEVNSERQKPLCEVMLAILTYFKDKALTRIKQRFESITNEHIFWVLAVPSAWKQETSMLYRDLAIESGIPYKQLKMVTEPEACLSYSMQYLRNKELVSKKNRKHITEIISRYDARVMLIDLSSDATTLSVHRISGDKTFKMIYQNRSHRKGSEQVNEQFLLFLSNIFGEDIIRTLRTGYKDDYMTMVEEFEMKKRDIKPGTGDKDTFALYKYIYIYIY